MAFARPTSSVIFQNEILYRLIDKSKNTDTPYMCFSEALDVIVSGTGITQVNQFSLVNSNVLNTMSQAYGLQYKKW